MYSSVSPIIIFVYKRDIQKTINSLLNNNISKDSDLYIFSDGNKNNEDLIDVELVRKKIKLIEGFKSLTIIESDKNKGLANSIIAGVSKIINKYGKVIVVEDDLIVSNDFLQYSLAFFLFAVIICLQFLFYLAGLFYQIYQELNQNRKPLSPLRRILLFAIFLYLQK